MVEYLEAHGVLSARTLLVHGVQVSAEDRVRMRRTGAAWAHCPKSNAKLGNGVAPLEILFDLPYPAEDAGGVRVGLGSDSVASNNTMDLFEEMRFAVLMQRGARHKIAALSAQTAVEMATIGGAQALGLASEIGTLEAGKRADLCVVGLDGLHSVPCVRSGPCPRLHGAGRGRALDDDRRRNSVRPPLRNRMGTPVPVCRSCAGASRGGDGSGKNAPMETRKPMTHTPALLRFGMIGCGALGCVHAQRLGAIPGVQIAALSDASEAAMQRVASEISSAASAPAFTDYREMLATTELDAVCISSPNRLHVEQLLASLDHGLHVLCEKPLSLFPDEVTQVVEATHRANRVVAIAYQSRYRRDSRLLRHELQTGKWGRITSVNIYSSEDWITPNVGTWRHDPARCPGGFFADANGHQLDLLFWVTDMAATDIHAKIEQRGTPIPIATWGDARLIHQGVEAPGDRHGAPLLTFNFVGDARHWHKEITIHTERADFVMRDTHLLWSDGPTELAPFPGTTMIAPEMPDLPDTAFVWAIRNQEPILSAPESVRPVLNFTREALAVAGYGLEQ